MKLVIGNMDKKTIDFIKRSSFSEKMLIINKNRMIENQDTKLLIMK